MGSGLQGILLSHNHGMLYLGANIDCRGICSTIQEFLGWRVPQFS